MYSSSYYDYSPYTSYSTHSYGNSANLATAGLAIGGFMIFIWILSLVLIVIKLIGLWKVFSKAGHAGWESLIGGHNIFVELEMAGIKGYWFFLLFVPIANIVVTFWKDIELAKSFGKGTGFGVGMALLPWIFIPILGFGKSEYMGPTYHEANYNTNMNNNQNYNSNMNNNNQSYNNNMNNNNQNYNNMNNNNNMNNQNYNNISNQDFSNMNNFNNQDNDINNNNSNNQQ